MSVTIHEILCFSWPNRGGWRVFGDEIAAGDGEAVPSMEEIESMRPAAQAKADADLAKAEDDKQKAAQRTASRHALRQQWDALPDYIRGPFRDKFEAVNRLLDEGDDAAAVALIEYAEPPALFSASQLAIFAATKTAMRAGILAMTQAS
jgi:hypothetical protein